MKNFKWNLPTYAPILVVTRIRNENDIKEVDVSIGSEVLFIDMFSLKVYESYSVNKIHVTRYLGQFHDKRQGKYGLTFFQAQDYASSIEKRRRDFYGVLIKVVTTKNRLGISDPTDFTNEVKFFPNNDTFDVTNMVTTNENKEVYFMILKWMEAKFNFTLKAFMRKDMKFGAPEILSNGSIVLGDGAFRDVFEGSVDLLCTTVVMLPERVQFGAFLPPINLRHDAIYIPFADSNEYLDLNVFFRPFSTELWMVVILKCIILSIFVYVVEWFHDYKLVGFDIYK